MGSVAGLTLTPNDGILSVAADGVSSIDLKIKTVDGSGKPRKNTRIFIELDKNIGYVVNPKTKESMWEFRTNEYGEAIIRYVAPIYFKPTLPDMGDVNIRVTASDELGRHTNIYIRVYRPPIILVHGTFSSSRQAWRDPRLDMYSALLAEHFAVDLVDYDACGPIADSADVLADEINSMKKDAIEGSLYSWTDNPNVYGKVNVRKVHIVAHSQGGLVARLYSLRRAGDVLTIIMIGVPNHGSPWAVLSALDVKDWCIAGQQQREGSSFLKELNDRINPEVDHLVIAGTRPYAETMDYLWGLSEAS